MKPRKYFEIIVPLMGDKPVDSAIRSIHAADVTLRGIAYNHHGDLSYDLDEVFVKLPYDTINLECKRQLEAVYGPLSEDDRFHGAIMAHIESLDWSIRRDVEVMQEDNSKLLNALQDNTIKLNHTPAA